MERILTKHSRHVPRSEFSSVPLAGVVNDLNSIFTNPEWVKYQGKEGAPNYLVVNLTREDDAPGLLAAVRSGSYPSLREEIAAQIQTSIQQALTLPHVREALAQQPGLKLGCSNLYINGYPGPTAEMHDHTDKPASPTVLWTRSIAKYFAPIDLRLPLTPDLAGTQFKLVGVRDGGYVQRSAPAGSLTINGARVLKLGQTPLSHRFQHPGPGLEGVVYSLQVDPL